MTQVAFVWDLDGTLIDSYPAILGALSQTYHHYGWTFDKGSISSYILQYSVGQLLDEQAQLKGIELQQLKSFYSQDLKKRDGELHLFPETFSVLEWTKTHGIRNFLYTHKGENTLFVLKELGIADYFTEVLHSQSGFARKPHPEAMDYLVSKYQLDKSQTYYIGDRLLDKEFATNSGVQSLNLILPDSQDNTHIPTLSAIKALPFWSEM